MKILAIEKEIADVEWDKAEDLLKAEAHRILKLYLSNTLREIYFTENRNAVLILEANDMDTAKQLLDSLPLAKSGKITFDMMELRPYTGYERLI